MFDDELSADERLLIEAARCFAQAYGPQDIAAWEAAGRIPHDVLMQAKRCGFLRTQVPTACGGHGYGYRCKMRMTEELAKFSMAAAFSIVNLQNAAAKLANDAHPNAAKALVPRMLAGERFGATALTEAHAGSDFSSIAMRAERSGDGWRLNGEKCWITNAAYADVFVCYAQTDTSAGWRGIACFLIDATRPGFTRTAPIDVFGGKAIGTGGFKLTDFHLPDEYLIHPAGEAFKYALGSINGARTYVAAMCCGMLDDALQTARTYLQERTAFGGPLLNRQGLRWTLADMATELEAARLLTYRAARLVEEGAKEAVLAAAHAKKYAARVAQSRLLDCIQLLGANGMRTDCRLGHHLACAKIAGYVDGSTEIQNERIAALLLD